MNQAKSNVVNRNKITVADPPQRSTSKFRLQCRSSQSTLGNFDNIKTNFTVANTNITYAEYFIRNSAALGNCEWRLVGVLSMG